MSDAPSDQATEQVLVTERNGRIMAGYSPEDVIEGDRETMVQLAEEILNVAGGNHAE